MMNKNSYLAGITSITIAVHGVRTEGSWGRTLHDSFFRPDERFSGSLYLTQDYPKLPAILGWGASWFPGVRHRYTKWMIRKLRRLQMSFPEIPIDVVCHSYGTWITYHAVRIAMKSKKPIYLRTLITVGSVLDEWDELEPVKQGFISRIVNYWSSNDRVVKYAPIPFGQAGYKGFMNAEDPILSARVRNEGDWKMGHGGYFSSGRFYQSVLNDLAPEDSVLKE